MQFFGFKNPLVQRLLRELVANVNGTAERNLSSSCNLDSKVDNDSCNPYTCTFPDLQPYLERPQFTGKRSRRREIISSKSASGIDLKRPKCGDITCIGNASKSSENLRYSTTTKTNNNCKHPAPLPQTVNSPVPEENKCHLAGDGFPLNSFDASNQFIEDTVPAQEARMHINSGKFASNGVASNLSKVEKHVSTLPPLSYYCQK